MISIVFVFFTVLAFSRGTNVHFRLFNKVELRDIGTGENTVTDFALGEFHQCLQVFDKFFHAFLIFIKRYSFFALCDEGCIVSTLLLFVELFLLLFESLLVCDEWLQVRAALDDADVVERCEA